MSLIQGIITEDFILVGFDKCDEKPNQVIKPSKQIIIGCDGNLADTARLLKGYCSYNEEKGILSSSNPLSLSYIEFIQLLENRFTAMQKEHEDKGNDTTYELNCIVCGHNGKEFEITIFTLGRETLAPNGIIKAKKVSTLPYQGITLGEAKHSEHLHMMVHSYYHNHQGMNLLQYKHVLQDVFAAGKGFDPDIQGELAFEKIRKKDVK